jgi:ribosomal subunit interface protein
MELPHNITFHNMEPSRALESYIRRRLSKLQRMCDRLVYCRVSLEALHKQHRTGNVVEVHISMEVPLQGELVISHAPTREKDRYSSRDVLTSIRSAFAKAEQKLRDYKERLRADVKTHPVMFQGQVGEMFPDKDYGFIVTHEGKQLYFHRNSVMNRDFANLKQGDAIHFVEEPGDTGPTASKVWVGPEHHLD